MNAEPHIYRAGSVLGTEDLLGVLAGPVLNILVDAKRCRNAGIFVKRAGWAKVLG